jgi:hypothetical protein
MYKAHGQAAAPVTQQWLKQHPLQLSPQRASAESPYMIEMWIAHLTQLCDQQGRFILTLFRSKLGQQVQF